MNTRSYAWSQGDVGEGQRCASCGASLNPARSSNQSWLLESLLPRGASTGPNLCSACRQRRQDHRIGAVVSTRI